MPSRPTKQNDPSIDWVGSHSAISFSQVLKRVAGEERSGDLQVSFRDAIKTVYFKDGQIVFAASNVTDDRLGESMMMSGCISEREFILASSMMQTEGRKFGEALVRMRLITGAELEQQLCRQFHRIVLSLFPIREGVYSFEERTTPIPEGLMVNLSIPDLLLNGFRKVEDEEILLACLPSPNYRLRATEEAFTILDVETLRPEERAVLHAARDGATLQAVLQQIGGDWRQVLRACSALFAAGFLEPEAQAEPTDLDRKIRSEYVRTENLTETELLQVAADIDGSQLEKAYRTKRLKWSHVNRLVENEVSLEVKVSEIQFRLAAAYHSLLLKKQRESSAGRGSRQSKPGNLPSSRLETSTQETSRHKSRVRKLLRGVQFHVSVEDWEGAVPLLRNLVKLEPGNSSYHGILAKATFKHPSMRHHAEKHFLEAIRLSPRDTDLRIWLGLYYRSFGKDVRAEKEFRAALAIDPNLEQAKEFLSKGGSVNRAPKA